MHDKGSAFWSWRGISRFTALLTELGIDQVVAEHKEWNGKVEVFNGNLHKELFDVHRFYDVSEMRRRLGLPSVGVDQILGATGAKRSSAYEAKARILEVLPTLLRPVGRPAAAPAAPSPGVDGISRVVLRFVMEHPGCVQAGPVRSGYSATFRRRILELRGEHPELDLHDFVSAVQVPVDTLRDWMRAGPQPVDEAKAATHAEPSPGSLRIQTVLAEWERWEEALKRKLAAIEALFANETFWPEFQELYKTLRVYLEDVTERVIREAVHPDASDAKETPAGLLQEGGGG